MYLPVLVSPNVIGRPDPSQNCSTSINEQPRTVAAVGSGLGGVHRWRASTRFGKANQQHLRHVRTPRVTCGTARFNRRRPRRSTIRADPIRRLQSTRVRASRLQSMVRRCLLGSLTSRTATAIHSHASRIDRPCLGRIASMLPSIAQPSFGECHQLRVSLRHGLAP
jgi:hypothetical protein